MNLATLEKIKDELVATLAGRRPGRIFLLTRNEIAIDFRLPDSLYLFISVDPGDPRTYLIRRRLRDLEKASLNPSSFIQQLKKQISSLTLTNIRQIEGERVLIISFAGENELGENRQSSLTIQLTGRSANLFLLDENGFIVDSMRQTNGEGQEVGTTYVAPQRPSRDTTHRDEAVPPTAGFASLSEALDAESQKKQFEREFQNTASATRAQVKQEISKREKLLRGLESDLIQHGDADKWKKYGDLLLANIATAKRDGSKVIVVDYFDENQSSIEIETDENNSLTEAAEKFFKRYTKARNAREEIRKRKVNVGKELERFLETLSEIENAVTERDLDWLAGLTDNKKQKPTVKQRGKESPVSTVARIFRSSDDFEILVGKKAKDNDYLTFRIAKSLDTWMHAADYPGSHVVIRNPNRKEIPQRTLLEAAQLAAFYSQGKAQPKAAVHYTQKKYVNKPKGSAAGLVSLASFKTLLVEPAVPDLITLTR